MTANLLLCLVFALAPAAPPDAARGDRQKLQGEWRVVSLEQYGMKMPEKKLATRRLRVAADRMTDLDGDEVEGEAEFRLDAAAKPRAIDIKFISGPDKGKTAHGIYQLEAGRLTICAAEPGKKRPTEFEAGKGSDRILIVLEPVKP